jgi:transposase-like protein
VRRRFVIDGSKVLAEAIRRSFGRRPPIQRRRVHNARNITGRLPKALHATMRRTLHQAWELEHADKAEKLIRAPCEV